MLMCWYCLFCAEAVSVYISALEEVTRKKKLQVTQRLDT